MKIETKLALNNMKKNKKRTLYTTISLILCTALILTTILLISSIRNGVSENFDTEYNDYHIILKDLSPERFNKIKNKEYIDKIYIQKNEDESLKKVDSSFEPEEDITVYLRYKNIKKVCSYTDDIIKEIELDKSELRDSNNMFKFNKKLLTVHGFIDIHITEIKDTPKCLVRVNYSYVIDLMIVLVIAIFSALFIIILYNAFLITINERKKEYAVLNSVGGTEGQVLKMVFTEAILIGIVGIFIGGMLSTLFANIVLHNINGILNRARYYFKLIFDIKHIILSVFIIGINIYLSVLIPSVKASSTSVMERIKNSKEIKNKKRKTLLERILPVEGKVAIKNIRRNKSKYRLIIFLLVICMTSFISISTYINYEKETADLVSEYDVDAELDFESPNMLAQMGKKVNTDYKTILRNYETKYNKKIEYMEYRIIGQEYFLVEPKNAFINNEFGFIYENKDKSVQTNIIVLDDATYNKYIKETGGNYGDIIAYNNFKINYFTGDEAEHTHTYSQIFKSGIDLKLTLVQNLYENEIWKYEVVESEIPNRKIILTDKLVEGYKEIKSSPFLNLFINMETYNKLDNYIEKTYPPMIMSYYEGVQNDSRRFWNNNTFISVKIKCDDVVEFKNYIEEYFERENCVIAGAEFYTLENQEKLIYINIIELILKVIMAVIITIGIVSTINIMNASLIERKEDFNILYRMGTTKGNVKKILIYECIYMFVKALIISAILSIPIIYKIIEEIENVLVINKLLIPFGSIGIFIGIMLGISLLITLYSTRMIKEE